MSLWNELTGFLSDLLFGEVDNSPRTRSSSTNHPVRKNTRSETPWSPLPPLERVHCRVEYVDRTFVKVSTPQGHRGVILGRHLATRYVEDAHALFAEGQTIEAIVVGPSTKKAGEYLFSAAAIDEFHAREVLRELHDGDEVQVEVEQVEAKRVWVRWKGARGLIQLHDLTRKPVDSCSEVTRVGEVLRVRVKGAPSFPPIDFDALNKCRCLFRASARVLERIPTVRWTGQAQRFALEIAARVEPTFDVVAQYCLRRIAEGASLSDLSQDTGMPEAALQAIRSFLRQKQFLDSDGAVTERGQSLAAALSKIERLEERPIQGWFVSAAPADQRMLGNEEIRRVQLPPGFPLPPRASRMEKQLRQQVGTELVELPWDTLADTMMAEAVERLSADPWLRPYVRLIDEKAAVELEVPEDWVLALLWQHLQSAQRQPPAQPSDTRSAEILHLVELLAKVRGEGHVKEVRLLWEPCTRTLWREPESTSSHLVELPELGLPEIPTVTTLARQHDGTPGAISEVSAKRWLRLMRHGKRRPTPRVAVHAEDRGPGGQTRAEERVVQSGLAGGPSAGDPGSGGRGLEGGGGGRRVVRRQQAPRGAPEDGPVPGPAAPVGTRSTGQRHPGGTQGGRGATGRGTGRQSNPSRRPSSRR
jgi:hypothetical protein